jgi:hypothetical protein
MAKDRGKLIGMYVKEEIAEAVRKRAFDERCSKAEVLRRALKAYLGPTRAAPGTSRKQQRGRLSVTRSRPAKKAAVLDTA